MAGSSEMRHPSRAGERHLVPSSGRRLFLARARIDNDLLIQIGAPVMGLALLYGIYVFLTRWVPDPSKRQCEAISACQSSPKAGGSARDPVLDTTSQCSTSP